MSLSVGCMACETEPVQTGPPKKGRFGELLTDDDLYAAFENFLRTEYAEENLQFYKDVAKFEHLASTLAEDDVRKLAQSIAAKYLGIGGGEKVLNLPDRLISEIEAGLGAKRISPQVFAQARMDIESILFTKYVSFSET